MNHLDQQKKRVSFSDLPFAVSYPDLLESQLQSCRKLFRVGNTQMQKKKDRLYELFEEHFPIVDSKGNYTLEFLGYTIVPSPHTPDECISQGISYEVALKLHLRLTCKDKGQTKVLEETVYLCKIPYITPCGSFIYKGIERAIIAQLQRAYGVFFAQTKHISGVNLYTAKIIPEAGTWIEFLIDIHNTMYVYLDRRKKIPVTILLRAIGYGTDKEILQLFDLAEEIQVTKANLKKHIGRRLAGKLLRTWEEDFVDEETGEVITIDRNEIILPRNTVLDEEAIEAILASKQKNIMLLKGGTQAISFIYNTLKKDTTNSEKEAINYIYYELRNVEPSDEQAAKEFVRQLLFSPKRSFVGRVGRYSLNKKLELNIPDNVYLLTEEDIIATIKEFAKLINGTKTPEDQDSLANQILRVSGDLFEQALNRGIRLLVNYIKEILDSRSDEDLTPSDIVNNHYLISAINTFFGLNPNSQYMDQENILSRLEHQRRITKLGQLKKERVGFEARDLNLDYFRRLGLVDTPEGLCIGLILYPTLYSKADVFGFMQTPYKKVIDGKVQLDKTYYLNAQEEENKVIAQTTKEIDKNGVIKAKKIIARDKTGEFVPVTPKEIDYIELRKDQALATGSALIPFVENTDASRATMGSNMQRQAVPLLRPEKANVGTGHERRVVRDARILIVAQEDSVVEYVDATKIIVREKFPAKYAEIAVGSPIRTYTIPRLKKTNQGTCMHQTPIVQKGQVIKKGDFLTEGYSAQNGELALGKNLSVAFMSYYGSSFEDSIVISDRLIKEDILTSIHIKEFVVDLYNTKLGPEEFTGDIPDVSEEALADLAENGIVRVGKEIKAGDILVGKITPMSNENQSFESKLIAAIFGHRADNARDTSFKVPFGCEGTVIATEVLEATQKNSQEIKKEILMMKKEAQTQLNDLRLEAVEKLYKLLEREKIDTIPCLHKDKITLPKQKLTKEILQEKILPLKDLKAYIDHLFIGNIATFEWTKDKEKNEQITYLFERYQQACSEVINYYKRNKKKREIGAQLPVGVIKQAKIYIAEKCKIEVGDKLAGRHGNKGVISKIVAEEDMPYHADGSRPDILINCLSLPSRMNIGQVLESLLGWAAEKLQVNYVVPVFEGPNLDRINEEMAKANLPKWGLAQLYDGLTGEPLDQPVTCGKIYILKLNHLVRHKITARNTGSYTNINQQAVSGRQQNGGQKVGELLKWTLNAHGVACIAQQMTTTKSDSTYSRKKALEAIYKGINLPSPSVPEALKVFEQILTSLCINLNFRS